MLPIHSSQATDTASQNRKQPLLILPTEALHVHNAWHDERH